jgi:hypothetical protein
MKGGPHVWIIGDEDEAPSVPIPRPSRLAAALQAIPEAIPKTHVHITRSGDARRFLHGDGTAGDWGIGGDSNTWAERLFMPTLLADVAEWSFPRQTTPGGYRVFGWMKTREIAGSDDPRDDRPGFSVWLGSTPDPEGHLASPARDSGGCQYAAEMIWNDAGRQFEFAPVTSRAGYVAVQVDGDRRSVRFGDNEDACTADFTAQNSGVAFLTIPETNTSRFSDIFASGSISGLRVPEFEVPADYAGKDAECTYVDRYGDQHIVVVYLAGRGGEVVPARFACQELAVQLTGAGSDAGRAVGIRLRPAICAPTAPLYAVLGVWDDVSSPPAKLTLSEVNLVEGYAVVDAVSLASTYQMIYAEGPLAEATRVVVNMNTAPVVTTLDDLVQMGAAYAWHSDALVVGSPVSSWTDEIAAEALSSISGKQPDPGVDGDGIPYVGFTATNQDRLGADVLLGNPNEDFTLVLICTFPNNTAGRVLDWSHVVHNTGGYIQINKGNSGGNVGISVSAQLDGSPTTNALSTDVGQTVTASSTVKRIVVLRRKGDTMAMSVDGSTWSEATISGTFGTTNLRLTLGGWWANTIDDYFAWSDVRMHAVLFFPLALSRSQIDGVYAYEKTRMVF